MSVLKRFLVGPNLAVKEFYRLKNRAEIIESVLRRFPTVSLMCPNLTLKELFRLKNRAEIIEASS